MMKEKLIVLGSGESGIGAAILGKQKGYDVFLSDINAIPQPLQNLLNEKGIVWESGQHSLASMKGASIAVKSPGIPKDIPVLEGLRENGTQILSEIEFAAQSTSATLIGITGTNGKTTTTMMTYEILKNAGLHVGLAGNIGSSFAKQVAEQDFEYYVLEISSFQLDDIDQFSPHIAVITNITPDHLDRYDYSFESYIQAKLKITKNQSSNNFFLFNSDDEVLVEALNSYKINAQKVPFGTLSQEISGSYLEDDKLILKHKHQTTMIHSVEFPFSGRHNLLNAMAAATIGNLLSINKKSIRESLTHFKGAPHRMENVVTIQRVNYINDSKATNINATYFALDSIQTPLIWIVGGVDKGNDYDILLPLIRKKAKAVICLGVDNSKLRDAFEQTSDVFMETESMTEAVKIAHKLAEPKDTVLLSPACASFDLFKNYEDRGDQFKAAVRNL
ncbi:UDP-N-acetylmuramoyl-L-alanine--D-glutamate ligase [Flavobacteriaceae bacterium]|nr:UDP-N-acetylmuramoyl-L-alanine--D-glutamate ligase [Flavobacteriaceae bacterium]MDA9572239.1 UDP-N-acetylmuramoyl-L-alanine--D-glutamate ligase [Flavobacteriaceae bacterium]